MSRPPRLLLLLHQRLVQPVLMLRLRSKPSSM